MNDESRTKKELIQDLVSLRKKIASLEKSASKRTRSKKALQDSEEIFRTIFEAASDGILIVDRKTKHFVTGNPSICRMLGYTADELATIGIKDIHPEAALPHVMKFIKDMAAQKNQYCFRSAGPHTRRKCILCGYQLHNHHGGNAPMPGRCIQKYQRA